MKDYKGETFQKILVVQTAFPGDVVLALPVARAAKKLLPEPVVGFLVNPVSGIIFKNKKEYF
jgi:ADP-heptose:LPS heptosyltransferase